jgi:hemimethylated DNA binding protein
VICGMDPVCCESKSWMETANVEKLSKGPNQPFYQVDAASDFVCSYSSQVSVLSSRSICKL